MKKVIIAIIILAVVGGGAFFLLKGEQDPPAASNSDAAPVNLTQPETNNGDNAAVADEVTVKYNGSSFSPASVTVKPGAKVNFVNESSSPMWVASDPHPVHTDFAEFDAKRNYIQGQTYSFTFEESGEYGYHNHSNSSVTGTVVVE